MKVKNRLIVIRSFIYLFISGLCCFYCGSVWAESTAVLQQSLVKITGKVVDTSGEPIIGANIQVKGSKVGTVTDMNGHFVLSTEPQNSIAVTFMGYKTKILAIGNSRNFVVILDDENNALNEVVVVGFGTQKKVNLTGSVTTVNSKDLASRPVVNAAQALEGLVPGLQITQSNGSLDNTPSINIRGKATIGTGSSGSPLILIDGMEADINTINPQDIESISILKDAAASSIYGSRAPFGVILITTKSGGDGKVSINYNNSFRFNAPVILPHEMDSYTFATYFNDAYANANWGTFFTTDHLQRIKDYQNGTLKSSIPANGQYWQDGYSYGNDNVDWYKAIYKSHNFSQEHNISARGGNEKNSYYFSIHCQSQILLRLNRNFNFITTVVIVFNTLS